MLRDEEKRMRYEERGAVEGGGVRENRVRDDG